MYKELLLLCCAVAFILVSTTEAKGGRSSGGRSSGRSSSSSSGRGGFFSSGSSSKSSSGSGGFFSSSSGSKSSSGSGGYVSSSSGSKSSSGRGGFFGRSSGSKSSSGGSGGYVSSSGGSKSSNSGSSGSYRSHSIGGKSGNSFSGGWFHGFFHNTPYHYTYRPTHIVYSSSSSNTGSYQSPTQEEEVEQKKETSDYAVGYSISKALNSDFFSIFNVVHDVAKYPGKIRNKELLTTTTQSPVATYDLNYIVKLPHTTPRTTYGHDSASYLPDEDMVESKTDFGNYDGIQESLGNLEKVFEVTSTETTTTKIETTTYSPEEATGMGWMNFKNEMQSSTAKIDLQVASTESTTTKADTTSHSPDVNTLVGRTDSKKRFGLDDSIMKDLESQSFYATKESIDEMLKRIENSYSSLRLFP